ncbi:MAG: 4Fe-4S dicluster domain-containing protein [Clostridiales bacterium]|nr:4Fe-4S dicluster domain-containing protein [Clostridiales bacterium]
MKKLALPLGAWLVFSAIAVTLFLVSGHIFYLFNFLYIGTMLAIGLYLYIRGYRHARRVTQLGVGLYMLVFLGFILGENMQLSGFFYYLFLGVFQAAVIHYAVAKIIGPFLFGRGWCGYACWTAMVLDFLPFKVPADHARRPGLGVLRYIVFAVTLLFVVAVFLFLPADLERILFITFIAGNVVYYAAGIYLAYRFRGNHAFCKYLCPVTVFLKPASYFALVRVRKSEEKCVNCKKCVAGCPMDVDMLDNSRKRKNATECILCGECIRSCPKNTLKV